jgi:type II secretory ATPase GspE/PulE/Tfp pilus assembly ATPase PilB-like protein
MLGLRSALRQDPDIIMVGEIRDEETARTAIDAALTGHLVFSTLHTNNAAGAFTRLIDLKVNPKVITSALSASLAQRLIRKLCPNCRKEVTLEGKDKESIEKIVAGMPYKDEITNTTKMWVPAGCEKCSGIGYKGRIGVYEAILSSGEIEKVVEANPSEREIQKVARAQGIYNMAEDGVAKVLQGITSLDELKRVVDIENTN